MIHEELFNTLLTGYSLMFESILRHKQVVIAAIAITALAGYVVPLNQFAVAQDGEDAFTTLEDIIAQEGTATATGEQNPSIDADNTQTNAIVTGDATATQTNTATSSSTARSTAVGGSAEGGDGGDACGDCDRKDGKNSWSDGGSNDGDGGNAIGGNAFSAAQSGSSASVNNNVNVADSSADNNDQSNTNTQSFDLDLDQEVEAEVEQDAFQLNDNYFNLDLSRLPGND
jgi:hypothetical protein